MLQFTFEMVLILKGTEKEAYVRLQETLACKRRRLSNSAVGIQKGLTNSSL